MEKLLCSITGVTVLLRAMRLDHCVLAISFTERSNTRLIRSSLMAINIKICCKNLITMKNTLFHLDSRQRFCTLHINFIGISPKC